MKKCSKCNKTKELSEFYKDKTHKDGLVSHCKLCKSAYHADWYVDNKDLEIARVSEYYLANTVEVKAQRTAWAKANPNKVSKIMKRYAKNNPGKVKARKAKRRAAELQRTPDWLSKEHLKQIQEFYDLASELSWLSEGGLHVDHMVPLRGKNVSGLHVPWNLQIIPAQGPDGNFSKGNKFIG